MPTTVEVYPGFVDQVRGLVQQHRKVGKPRLRLAVYFAPVHRAKRDIFLFEVIDGFGGNSVDPDRRLFEFGYGPTPVFPMPDGTTLRMILTNPTELEEAVRNDWKGLEVLRAARKADRTILIYADAKGKRLWEMNK
jgi:hypothetical protein